VAGLAADACDDGGLSDIRQIFQTGRGRARDRRRAG